MNLGFILTFVFLFFFYFLCIFRAPEQKVLVHYFDHTLSVVRPLLTFHMFDFFSKTAERNSTKHDRKQDPNVIDQVRVFRADRKNKMASLASIG